MKPATQAAPPPPSSADYTYDTVLKDGGWTRNNSVSISGWEQWSLAERHFLTVAPRGDGTALVKSVGFDSTTFQMPSGSSAFACVPLTDVEITDLDAIIAQMDQRTLAGDITYVAVGGARTANDGRVKCFNE